MKTEAKSQKPKKVKRIFIILLIAVFICVFFVINKFFINPKDDYEHKKYSKEETITMFETNRSSFNDVASVLDNNAFFWKEARSRPKDPNNLHAWIYSPNDRKRMKLFSKQDQETLRNFFMITGPVQITMDLSDPTEKEIKKDVILEKQQSLYLRIYYVGSDATDGYGFIYFYDVNTEEDISDYMIYIRSNHEEIISMGDRWYLYYR